MARETIKVLLIEDNKGDALLIAKILEGQGRVQFVLERVDRLAAGIERLKTGEHQVILLDLSLPDGQGLDTFSRLKPQARDVPVVVLTGTNDEEVAAEAVRRGAQDYLVKDGLEASTLVRALLYAVERAHAETKRRWLETKVLHAQKLETLSMLGGNVAHSFAGLMTAILGNTEMALDKMPDDSPAFRNLQKIYHSARKAADLVGQMLSYYGKNHFPVERLNLSNFLREMMPVVQTSVPRHIAFTISLADDVPEIKADLSQLRQAVLNLVSNAVEAVGDRSGALALVTFTARIEAGMFMAGLTQEAAEPGQYACLEVRDDGRGISREVISRIFDPFFTTKFSGRGLGLAAVLGIVRGHAGFVTVESEPGKGTAMRLFFPALPENSDLEAGPKVQKKKLSGCILFMDQDPEIRSLAKTTFEKASFIVFQADTPDKAREWVENDPIGIDLVVLDLPAFGASLFSFLPQIIRANPAAKILVTTALESDDLREKLAHAGVDGVLLKPFGTEKLLKKVHEMLTLNF